MRLLLSLVCCLSSCCSVFGQVPIQATYQASEPVLLIAPLSDDPTASQLIDWEIEGPGKCTELRLAAADGRAQPAVAVASVPGEYKYKITAVLTQEIDYQGKKIRVLLDGGFKQRGNFKIIAGDDFPTPGPVDPIESLVGTSKDSREAMRAFIRSMGANFDTLASEAKAGRFATVRDAGTRSNALDEISRDAFKQAMAAIMAPRLGTDQLPSDAAVVFSEIATGFKASVK